MSEPLRIRRLSAGEPAFDIVARWRYDAFFAQDGIAFDESRNALRDWMARLDGYEAALLAEMNGQPAGSCLFVREEIDAKHQLTPWLAALYVAPEYRKQGIGGALVRAIEQHAREVGRGTVSLHRHRSAAKMAYPWSASACRGPGARSGRLGQGVPVHSVACVSHDQAHIVRFGKRDPPKRAGDIHLY